MKRRIKKKLEKRWGLKHYRDFEKAAHHFFSITVAWVTIGEGWAFDVHLKKKINEYYKKCHRMTIDEQNEILETYSIYDFN